MIKYDINKDINLFLSFSDEAKRLTPKSNLKPERFMNIEAQRKLGIPMKSVCYRSSRFDQTFTEACQRGSYLSPTPTLSRVTLPFR